MRAEMNCCLEHGDQLGHVPHKLYEELNLTVR